MARYRAILAYDGTAYAGYQRQRSGTSTIQGVVETALNDLFATPTPVWASGRTDSGVHAVGQVIAFEASWKHGEATLLKAINRLLPDDIVVRDVRQHEGFHPRFDALRRCYRYSILVAPAPDPLTRHCLWHLTRPLDVEAMQGAADLVVGVHDFATFGHAPEGGGHTIRQIFVSRWQRDEIPSGERVSYIVEGNAFLYHMVRRLVGMMVEVGQARRSLEAFREAFEQADIRATGRLAPAHGLLLERVDYADTQ
jgi:tRNA pseudouridine38-40 synthase